MIYGVIEENGALPTPSFCMAHLPFQTVGRTDVVGLSTSTVAAVARDCRWYLAQLDDLDAVDDLARVDNSIETLRFDPETGDG